VRTGAAAAFLMSAPGPAGDILARACDSGKELGAAAEARLRRASVPRRPRVKADAGSAARPAVERWRGVVAQEKVRGTPRMRYNAS